MLTVIESLNVPSFSTDEYQQMCFLKISGDEKTDVDGVEAVEKAMDHLLKQTDDEYISGTLNEILKMD